MSDRPMIKEAPLGEQLLRIAADLDGAVSGLIPKSALAELHRLAVKTAEQDNPRRPVLEIARDAIEELDYLRHPNRPVRTARDAREALSQSRSVAGQAVDRLKHDLGDCGGDYVYCVYCQSEREEKQ